MIFPVTLTSQGQITIPAKIRRKMGFEKSKNLLASTQENKIVIEAVPDFLELSGSLRKYAIKNKSIDEIIRLEEEAIGEAIAERYRKKLKKMAMPFPQ